MRKKRILSEETKRKIGNSHRGMKHVLTEEGLRKRKEQGERKKGIKKGPLPEWVKEKIRLATLGKKKKITQENSGWFPKGRVPSHGFKKGLIPWNTGKRVEGGRQCKKYKEWAKAVKTRDGFICVICRSTKNLHAHHVIPWNERVDLRFNIENGQTLCCSCHTKSHEKWKLMHEKLKTIKRKKLSDESRKKISEALKGRVSWSKGKKLTEEHRKKLSEAKKKKIN